MSVDVALGGIVHRLPADCENIGADLSQQHLELINRLEQLAAGIIDMLRRDYPTAKFYAHGWSHEYPLADFWYYTCSHDWQEVRRARALKVTLTPRQNGTRIEVVDTEAFRDERTTYEVCW